MHVHAFSPLEVYQGATTLGLSVEAYLVLLRDAGVLWCGRGVCDEGVMCMVRV